MYKDAEFKAIIWVRTPLGIKHSCDGTQQIQILKKVKPGILQIAHKKGTFEEVTAAGLKSLAYNAR